MKNKKLLFIISGVAVLAVAIAITAISIAMRVPNGNYIGKESAKARALSNAGFSENEVTRVRCNLDYEDGYAEYDVSFRKGGVEYDYEIDATTGNLVQYDYEGGRLGIKLPKPIDTASYIGEAKAKDIAYSKANLKEADIDYVFCKLERDDFVWKYEVTLWSNSVEYNFDIDATTGSVLEYEVDSKNNTITTAPTTDNKNYISPEKAKTIALNSAGIKADEVVYIFCEFDYENWIGEYEVEFRVGALEYQYSINAITGAINEQEVEMDN